MNRWECYETHRNTKNQVELYCVRACCCNKLLRNRWLKTTKNYYLTVLDLKSTMGPLGKNQDIRRTAFDSGGSKGWIHVPALCSLQRLTVFPGAMPFVCKVSSCSTESNATSLWQWLFYLPFPHGRTLWSFKIIQNHLSLLNSILK